MKEAKEKLSAVFEFNKFGLLRRILLNSENEMDEAILLKGLAHILKPQKTLLKRIFRSYGA
jgi:hypothetical protein